MKKAKTKGIMNKLSDRILIYDKFSNAYKFRLPEGKDY